MALPIPKENALEASVIILAGGKGERLSPLTLTRCKPAVSFGGRYRLIDIPLSNSLNAHFRQIFVISQFFASDLNAHIMDSYHRDFFGAGGIEFLTPEETSVGKIWFKGTADAVRQNIELLLESGSEYFVILSGDQLYKMDLAAFVQKAIDTRADLVIAAHPVNREEASRMGLMCIDGNDRIVDFIEKPKESAVLEKFMNKDGSFLASMGIYVFQREALSALLKEEGDDFGKDLIPKQMKKGGVYAYSHTGYWEDIGTVGSYYRANLALIGRDAPLDMYEEKRPIFTQLHHLPSPQMENVRINKAIIADGSIVRAHEVSNAILGMRSYVDEGTIIRNAIVMGSSRPMFGSVHTHKIGKNCLIDIAILDENVRIGNNVRLVNDKKLQSFDYGNGVYIRDGIIVVSSGTDLPDNYQL